MLEKPVEWIASLRNGKYSQGKGELVHFDVRNQKYNYCCLGVLCCINGLATPLAIIEKVDVDCVILTKNKFGLKDDYGYLPILDRNGFATFSLTNLNDSGFTFLQIADIIEYFWMDL